MLPGQVEDREVGRKGSRVTWLSAECLDLLQGTTIDMKDKLDVIIMASTDAVLCWGWGCDNSVSQSKNNCNKHFVVFFTVTL